ncbi:putative cobalamin binding protein [Desulfosporosinus orientis DSM 765]|uniref:Putative cobalamin binding protein n=1 Tax=Desulfosporosinus orientis (strain ATCC 19365 / DSM 765 / NCIMB 8382 / VKM B-1628 / Singapore I) TaxID=768706 RepID=G7WIW5_DESOD|nr:corrinoid protein [Desulfosporosinus orientis]AET69690.1 putative cobalamin binding protein [Desulfosporosinus orientis DSM 765]
MTKIDEVKAKVEAGKAKLLPGLVQEALDEGNSAGDILQSMIDSMGIVGDKFSAGEVFVPEMLMAAKAMAKGVDVLKPHLTGTSTSSLGTCVIGTVQGDLHDIGKNLVTMMLESVGFKMIDLGVDVSTEKFMNAIKENENVNLVACSGLLTTTMSAMKETVHALKTCGLTGFKVMVGGAPVTQEMADEIGADGFAPDAGGAAVKAKELVKA